MSVPRLAVLVVDDDAAILRVFQSVLRDRAACTVASTGAEGLALLLSGKEWDWSFIDLRMQGTSGLDILRECHRYAPARLSRTTIITGAHWREDVEKHILEFTDPLTGDRIPIEDKPFGIEVVYKWIEIAALKQTSRGPKYDLGDRIAHGHLPPPSSTPKLAAPRRAPPPIPRRDSPPPDYDGEENTGSLILESARGTGKGPVFHTFERIAEKLTDTRARLHEHGEKIEKLEGHFEAGGMVVQIRDDVREMVTTRKVEAEADEKHDRRSFRWVSPTLKVLGMIVAAAVAYGALDARLKAAEKVHTAAVTPDARSVARELYRLEHPRASVPQALPETSAVPAVKEKP